MNPAPDRKNAVDDYQAIRDSHRAREILLILAADVGNRINDLMLRDVLHAKALGGTREEVSATISMLERSGLVRCGQVEDVLVLELTERGDDVAQKRASAEGVAKIGVNAR